MGRQILLSWCLYVKLLVNFHFLGLWDPQKGHQCWKSRLHLLTGFFLFLRFVFCRGEGTDIARVSGVSQDTGQEWLMRNWLRNF